MGKLKLDGKVENYKKKQKKTNEHTIVPALFVPRLH